MSTILRQITAALLLLTTMMVAGQGASAQGLIGQLVTTPEPEKKQDAPSDPSATAPVLGATETRLLVDLLRDDAAREALIGELERLAATRAGGSGPASEETAAGTQPGVEPPMSGAASETMPGPAD